MRSARIISIWLAVMAGIALGGELTVDVSRKHQVMHGFGTCIKTWGRPEKDPVVAGQYSPAMQQRYVEDLGLKVIRIPIHFWVLSGENPYGIEGSVTEEMKRDPTRITYRSFIWAREAGRAQGAPKFAIDWAKALMKRNPEMKLIGSVWSPPHWMKEPAPKGPGKKFQWSKFGANTCGGRLSPKYYDHYAHYLAEWAKGLKAVHGLDLYAISVQNELSFYEPYDSCVYTPEEFAEVTARIGKVFRAEGVKTRIIGPEDMTKFPSRTMGFVKAAMKHPTAGEALHAVCSHGYSDGVETSLEADDALKLWRMMQSICPGKEYWMTETGGGGGKWQPVTISRRGRRRVVPDALSGFATMLHNAVVHGHASVWCTWQYLDVSEGTRAGLIDVSGPSPVLTKKYQVQKHFSRWTPAGARRVEASASDKALLVTAFHHADQGQLTIVAQNHDTKPAGVTLRIDGIDELGLMQMYVTDASRDCAKGQPVPLNEGKGSFMLPARSIVTLVGVLKP